MTQQIFAAEINFDETPQDFRDKFNPSDRNVKRVMMTLKQRVDEVFVFANRARFTIYIVHEDLSPLNDFFYGENNVKGYVQFYYNTGESLTHLMATAAGLLSPVKGDAQVLTELSHCYNIARECSCLGITLDHTLFKVIEIGKKIRTETGIDKFCASVVESGLELLYDRLENLHQRKFLIIGTGKLARLALDYLTKEGILDITITGLDIPRVKYLGDKYGVQVYPLDMIEESLSMADVIIGASYQEFDFDFVGFAKRLGLSGGKSTERIVLDLGMPPNFDPQALDMFASEFYNIDDLRKMQPSFLDSFGGLEAAWRMVMKNSNDLAHLLQMLHHSPVLTAYLTRQMVKHRNDNAVRPKRKFRSILFFKRESEPVYSTPLNRKDNSRIHMNNHVAENGGEVVKHFQNLKRFKFLCPEN